MRLLTYREKGVTRTAQVRASEFRRKDLVASREKGVGELRGSRRTNGRVLNKRPTILP